MWKNILQASKITEAFRFCVYSNSRNDVPRVAQRYVTIAAHTRRRASVLVVLVVFCVDMYSFAGLIRRTPPPTFSDTAITDRHSDTTIFQLRAHWVRISWSIGSKNRSDMCPRWESNHRLPACKASTLSTWRGSPLCHSVYCLVSKNYGSDLLQISCTILICYMQQHCIEENRKKSQSYKIHQIFFISGSGCSKLTTSLVNVSLKFQTLISKIHPYFYRKKTKTLQKLLSFFNKYICVFGYKVVKYLTR